MPSIQRHIRIHIHIHIHIHTYTYAYIRIHIYLFMNLCIYVYFFDCGRLSADTWKYICMYRSLPSYLSVSLELQARIFQIQSRLSRFYLRILGFRVQGLGLGVYPCTNWHWAVSRFKDGAILCWPNIAD